MASDADVYFELEERGYTRDEIEYALLMRGEVDREDDRLWKTAEEIADRLEEEGEL